MNTNTIRYYLHDYENLKKEVKNLQEALDTYKKMNISGLKATVITDEPKTHNNVSKTEIMALTRIEYIADLENKLDEKMRLLIAINSVYYYLREPARSIIEMRYFISPMKNDIRRPKYNWCEISIEVDLNEDYCRALDCNIIKKIQEKLLRVKG